jgi:ribosomal protein S18 acetylase RimI-like enzyme
VIREFQADDIDGLFFLEQRCFEPPFAMDYPQLRALLKDPAIATLVIVGQAGDVPRMVGALLVRREPAQARLVMISLLVDPDYRRLGLGGRLAHWAQRAAAAAGLASVAMPVEAENAAGAAFLLAQGFAPGPDGSPFFSGPEDGTLWHRAVSPAETP